MSALDLHIPLLQAPLLILGFAGFGLILDALTGDELLFDMLFRKNRDRFIYTSTGYKLRLGLLGLAIMLGTFGLSYLIQILIPV